MEQKFYVCKHCENLVEFINNVGVPIYCCGDPMTPMIANSFDANAEKHVPVVKRTQDGVIVTVGSIAHPIMDSHYIDWIYLETMKGGQRKRCIDSPSATFVLAPDDMPTAAYAFCNLHGLWRTLL